MNAKKNTKTSAKTNALVFKNVSHNYYESYGEDKVLADISFEVKEGEFVSIVGPSGCGKTTILSIASGLLKQTGGEVLTQEQGYMFQKDLLFPWRTVYQNVILGLEIKKILTPETAKYADQLIEKYGLKEFRNAKPAQLSGGMRQRVALIRTLVLKPKILLLDEPFSALDWGTRLAVIDDVYRIIKSAGLTAMLVTHDAEEAASLSDKIVRLTARPSTVREVISLTQNPDETPSMRREKHEVQALARSLNSV
ncbi:MAG: ABC transporter ATP-binding protein [Christensenellaceae bacterium]|jgi:NitT/TauT family transport system ATP-binding protein|nr:ABC transporter ATP-binding protein [Christensenellaceae bacterium]